ncbi:hypothetical protein DPMN_146187 [Dreissena polymorpha]|uniref:Uncharacterized protein n=1 Tax=Dreissena polymorpha TaxID=45954 RepID=A0A9D4F856_DREPO|nr:hypothetical protein DPMN_146187 [Dreissena polymorpha]
MKTTADDNKWAIKAELCSAAVLRSDMNLSFEIVLLPVHIKVSLATVHWSIWI